MARVTTKIGSLRTERLILAAIILLAFEVRFAIARLDHVLQGDEGAYLWLGKTLVTGGGYQFFGMPELHYTPFYPLVSGLFWLVARDLELASKICFVLFGGLTALPVYLIGRRLYGRPIGLIVAALVAVAPALTSYVYFYGSMTEPLYFFLSFSGLYVAIVALEDDRWPAYAGAGALFGLSYLTRPEGWIYPVVTAVYVVLGWLLGRRRWEWRPLAHAFLMVATFLIVALPYLAYLHGHLGQWTLTGKTWVAYAQQRALMDGDMIAFDKVSWALDSTGQEVMYHSTDKFTRHSLLGEIMADPRGFASGVFYNVRQMDGIFLSKRVLPFFLLPLIGLGLFGSRWSARRLRGELYLALMAVVPTVAFLVFTTHLRFYLGTIIILLIWVSHGIVELGKWVGDTAKGLSEDGTGLSVNPMQWEAGTILACVLVVVVYYLAIQPAAVTDGLAYQRFHYKRLGEWLGGNSPMDATVMSRGAIVAIHANRRWVPFPHASYGEVMAYARDHDVDYMVVNAHEFEMMRPQLLFLADPEQAPSELDAVSVHEGDYGITVVYRLTD